MYPPVTGAFEYPNRTLLPPNPVVVLPTVVVPVVYPRFWRCVVAPEIPVLPPTTVVVLPAPPKSPPDVVLRPVVLTADVDVPVGMAPT